MMLGHKQTHKAVLLHVVCSCLRVWMWREALCSFTLHRAPLSRWRSSVLSTHRGWARDSSENMGCFSVLTKSPLWIENDERTRRKMVALKLFKYTNSPAGMMFAVQLRKAFNPFRIFCAFVSLRLIFCTGRQLLDVKFIKHLKSQGYSMSVPFKKSVDERISTF